MGVKQLGQYKNKSYYLRAYWTPSEELREQNISNLRILRCQKEHIAANPTSHRALASALFDLAWIRIALERHGHIAGVGGRWNGARCPVKIG